MDNFTKIMGKEIPRSFEKIRSGEQLNLKGRGFTNVASLTAAGITPAKNPGAVIYHEGHLYASAWTAATTGTKEKALVMATRLIDGLFQFNGFKRLSTQSLQWPRRECRDPDVSNGIVPGLLLVRGSYLDETKVPALVVNATCELARELIKQDRTDDPDGEKLRSLDLVGSLTLEFETPDRQPVVPSIVQTWLGKFGEYIAGTKGMARLVRT